MSNIINKVWCLKLNRAWQVVGQTTIGRAIVDLAAGLSSMALDIDYEKDENGNYILDENGIPIKDPISMIPVNWDTWITLPVRPWEIDDAIHYSNGNKMIRPITISIAKNFNRMPTKTFRGKPSGEAIRIRDNNTCQYTGRKLKREQISIDHYIPRSKGGKNDWTNMVVTDKETNSKKGDKLPSEAGVKLIRQPKAPPPIPLSAMIRDAKHPTWKPFLVTIDSP